VFYPKIFSSPYAFNFRLSVEGPVFWNLREGREEGFKSRKGIKIEDRKGIKD
jgi:hypothetical protein